VFDLCSAFNLVRVHCRLSGTGVDS
jgi:hypothetical protein